MIVAPHTGAWIETLYRLVHGIDKKVAPHTGAWIETKIAKGILGGAMSHPTRVRGLKRITLCFY